MPTVANVSCLPLSPLLTLSAPCPLPLSSFNLKVNPLSPREDNANRKSMKSGQQTCVPAELLSSMEALLYLI